MKTGVLVNILLQYLYHHSPSRQSYVFVFLQFLLGTKALKPKLTAANYTLKSVDYTPESASYTL